MVLPAAAPFDMTTSRSGDRSGATMGRQLASVPWHPIPTDPAKVSQPAPSQSRSAGYAHTCYLHEYKRQSALFPPPVLLPIKIGQIRAIVAYFIEAEYGAISAR
jgi:hypothetical protein